MTVEEAGARYRRWGRQEREHAEYCPATGRMNWRCWNYLGRAVEAASVALDMAMAAQHTNRLGSAPTVPVWMLPTPEQEAQPDGRAGTPSAARAARATASDDTCSERAAIRGVTAGSLSGPHAHTTTAV